MSSKYLPLLLHFLENDGIHKEVKATTDQLAQIVGVSQQTISRWLVDLEGLAYIKRHVAVNGVRIQIASSGIHYLQSIHQKLHKALVPGSICGKVVTGLGEGGYYMKKYVPYLEKAVGFFPYTGTLNITIEQDIMPQLEMITPLRIEAFQSDNRTFGGVSCYPLSITAHKKTVQGALLRPDRTSHTPQIIELIASVFLRDVLKLQDGDVVEVKFS
ncbi:CTP-dependent riboflavin kinase [Candidatus Woesearchaeota archaeon]|nr:CTP-dependent riboflavin kinase [Candidatus Woesearchaeota archaeon]